MAIEKRLFTADDPMRLPDNVHPRTRSVTAYRSFCHVRVLSEDEELDGGDVLPGFSCRVRDLFPY